MKEPSVTLNLVRTSLVIPTRGLSQDYRVLTGVGEGGGREGRELFSPKQKQQHPFQLKKKQM